MLLEKINTAGGPVFYISPQLREAGVPHAFSTRLGGLSPPPFDSLNLGNPSGGVRDDRNRILDNYALLERAAGLAERERCWLHQVHGKTVVNVLRGCGHDNAAQGDALVTGDSSRTLSVRVADCCPVLLCTSDGRHVAAVHSGWRGAVANVVSEALRMLLERRNADGLSASAGDVLAAIGPCIGFEAFEVGPEVLEEFQRIFECDAPVQAHANGKGRADIRAAIRLSLLAAGIPARNIDTTDRCTHRDRAEFFSHRRDKGLTGRMAALIATRQ